MPSKNSYAYYYRFLKCLKRHLERKVEEQKKDKWVSDPERLAWSKDEKKNKGLDTNDILGSFEYILDDFIEKAPSAQMGGDDWLDKFFTKADPILCPGMWCHDEHCEKNNGGYPYNCSEGKIPSKCPVWKAWRLQWRSFPEKTECKGCKYYKPEKPYKCPMNDKAAINRIYETNKYKCYCRAKLLPDGCPKKTKGVKDNAAE